jgi:transcriptional regulator with PAS, ATPase and Fis domain
MSPRIWDLLVTGARQPRFRRHATRAAAGAKEVLALEDLAGEDPQMLRIVRSARRVAASSVSVMIQGATGTGKELFARACTPPAAARPSWRSIARPSPSR